MRRRRPALVASDSVARRQSEAKTMSGHLVACGIGWNVSGRAGLAIARGHSSHCRSVTPIAQGLDRTLRRTDAWIITRRAGGSPDLTDDWLSPAVADRFRTVLRCAYHRGDETPTGSVSPA